MFGRCFYSPMSFGGSVMCDTEQIGKGVIRFLVAMLGLSLACGFFLEVIDGNGCVHN